MKKFYVMLVREEQTTVIEKALNTFQIAMSDWDRTRVLYSNGVSCVTYTIICTEDVFKSIKEIIKEH